MQAPGGSKDFKAQLSSVKAKNVDMIYMPIYYTEGAMTADAYKMIINAMNQCDNPKDRVCVNDKIRATSGFTGTLTLKDGDAICIAVINEVKNGKLAFKTVVNP